MTQSEDIVVGDAAPARAPGETGVWIFVAGDLLVFGIFFIVYLLSRTDERALFLVSQGSLNQFIGALNTLLLLTSSWCVALAVNSLQSGSATQRYARPLLAAAIILGAAFVVVKGFEWSERFAAAQTVMSNDFFMFYFMYTGIHLMHVLIGLAVLSLMFFAARRAPAEVGTLRLIESGGVFWHLVDLLWLILFALFYLVR